MFLLIYNQRRLQSLQIIKEEWNMGSKSERKQHLNFVKLLLSLVCVACIAFSAVASVGAETTEKVNQAVTNVRDSIVQVRMIYKKDKHDKGTAVKKGTGFLINTNTVITCAHVVDIDDDVKKDCKTLVGDNYNIDNLSLEVVVSNDVTIPVTVKKESQDIDFAILNLTEVLSKRVPAVIGNSDDVKQTQLVYALGFPKVSADAQNKETYTSDDATITSGEVSKCGEFSEKFFIENKHGEVSYIQHGATLHKGNSGGPLVDENGIVVGINAYTYENYNYSIGINQVSSILDELGIEYEKGSVAPVENTTEDTSEVEETTIAPATEEPIGEIETEPEQTDQPATDMTKTIIIIAIVALVIILIVVVVIIIISSKKKASDKIPPAPRGTMPTPISPQKLTPPTPPYSNSPYSPQTMPNNDGAGETSVLNEGAGETTVLGYQSTGAVLVRVSTKERININKPEFVIGKERRRVDYCISDNNSISRTHAKIKARAGKFYIADLGSTNCTYVNGNKLSPNQEIALNNGDKIKISDEEFEFIG